MQRGEFPFDYSWFQVDFVYLYLLTAIGASKTPPATKDISFLFFCPLWIEGNNNKPALFL